MRRRAAYLITAFVCCACFAPDTSDRHRATDVRPGTLRPNEECDHGHECPDDTGGAGSEDPPPDGGTDGAADGGKEAVPPRDPPLDTVDDPKATVDLLPVPNDDTYCPRDKDGALVVNIKNTGSVTSPETTTRVTFANVGDVSVLTPSIAAGFVTQHVIPIPPACFQEGNGNCTIVIHADAFLEVSEIDEGNNEVKDVCPGTGL